MKVVDLNLLLNAVNRDSSHHARARAYIERLFSGEETIGLPWPVVLGFIRVATNARVFARPLSVDQALETLDSWLTQPPVVQIHPGENHWHLLKELLREAGSAGNLTMDAHLAALAMENGAELVSTDADFARFRHLRFFNPLVA
ncbi:MAG: type II toxin-antitoxin system VapC family toxin [Gemmatimonadaceae bacterium]